MIYTGNYKNCKSGNLISISGDRGRKENFSGKYIRELAPKLSFWKIWESNIGKISEYENTKYYIESYYKEVLSKVDLEELLFKEENPILLCYEDSKDFCHRHVLAEFLEYKYDIKVDEISIDKNGNKTVYSRPSYIKEILMDVIK